jgi:hypothetical protein
MDKDMYGQIEKSLAQYGSSIQQIEKLYPKLYEPFMNLSVTGVSPRTYFYWKKTGLVGAPAGGNEEKGWVKINLIEYVWIKLIVTMREFGVPFEKIKETKELLFTDYVDEIIKEKDDYIAFIKENSTISSQKIKELDKLLTEAKKELDSSPEEFEIYHTLLATLMIDLLIKNDKGYIVLAKNGNDFDISYFSLKSIDDFKEHIAPLFDVPCLHIPIKSLIVEFIDDFKNEKHVESINLLNLKELKVIQAMREKDFKEIIIKQDGKKESIVIEIEKDGSILDQKAKEVKRILGLNEYSEVTIKFRNDKNLYFKNKTRL